MEIANPWLYYPALITSPIWCAALAAGIHQLLTIAGKGYGGNDDE